MALGNEVRCRWAAARVVPPLLLLSLWLTGVRGSSNDGGKIGNHMQHTATGTGKASAKKVKPEGNTVVAVQPHIVLCKTKLMVMIVSDVRQQWKRQALRSSWAMRFGDSLASEVRYFFVVGRLWNAVPPSILHEANEYLDIVIVPSNDFDFTWYTRKVILGMEQAVHTCQFDYFMKVTEFTFVNVYNIGEWLKKLPPQGVFRGRVVKGAAPQRDANSPWYISKDDYSRDNYLPYTQNVFLLSYDLFEKVLKMNGHYLDLYYDDAAVAVWLGDQEIKPEHDEAVALRPNCEAPVIIQLNVADLKVFGENMRDRSNHMQCYNRNQ